MGAKISGAAGGSCGLLIRRPQVRTLLGPLSDAKHKNLIRRLAAGTIGLPAFRSAFGVSRLLGGSR